MSQSNPDSNPANPRIGRGQWMTLLAAFLGWMFDGFEMGLFPLVGHPAMVDLLGPDKADHVKPWLGMMGAVFLIGAATGGVVFGWLGDRLGRVKAMTLSVLTYAVFMGLCGLAQTPQQMFFLRFLSALGMGGEWSLGVALVMELWPNNTRGLLAGLIGAAANVGFLLIAAVGLGMGRIVKSLGDWMYERGFPETWVSALVAHSGWRLMMLIGALPAVLTFFIRIFVPESEKWQHEQQQGKTSNWATQDLLGVLVGSLGSMAIIYVWAPAQTTGSIFSLSTQVMTSIGGFIVALLGFTFPMLRYLQRSRIGDTSIRIGHTLGRMILGASLSGVAFIGTWGAVQFTPTWAGELAVEAAKAANLSPEQQQILASDARAHTQILTGFGAVLGTLAGAMVAKSVGRRITYCALCLLSFAAALYLYKGNTAFGPRFLATGFAVGAFTAAFYGWLPLYLPELFRTKVRATGQGFSFNFGRILAAIGALQAGNLMNSLGGIPNACSYIILVYLVGAVIIWIAPETRGQPLPD